MMTKTIKPDPQHVKETEAHLPLIEDFLASLADEPRNCWRVASEFSLDENQAQIQVFGMTVPVPDDLLSHTQWIFRVSEPAKGIRILYINNRALGAAITDSVSLKQITNLPQEILCLDWDAYPYQKSPVLDKFSQLSALSLINCPQLKSIETLTKLLQLTGLNLIGCDQLHDLGPLYDLINLTDLAVVNSGFLNDLNPLFKLAKLKKLDLRLSTSLEDLKPLRTLLSLESLQLGGCDALTSFDPIKTLPLLKAIDLRNPYLAEYENEPRKKTIPHFMMLGNN